MDLINIFRLDDDDGLLIEDSCAPITADSPAGQRRRPVTSAPLAPDSNRRARVSGCDSSRRRPASGDDCRIGLRLSALAQDGLTTPLTSATWDRYGK
jgi:hypothetical protein